MTESFLSFARIASLAELEAALAEGGGRLELAADLRVKVSSGSWTIAAASGVNAVVEARGDAVVEARGAIRVEAWGQSSIVALDHVSVSARESATVEARDHARVEAYGCAGIVAYDDVDVVASDRTLTELWDRSHAECWRSASVFAWGEARVVARERSSVEARERSHVEALENSRIILREDATADACESANVTARDASGVNARDNCTVDAGDCATVDAWGECGVVTRGQASVVARGNVIIRAFGGRRIEATPDVVVMVHAQPREIVGGRQIAVDRPRSAAEWCMYSGVDVVDGVAILYQAVDADFANEEARRLGIAYAPGTVPAVPDQETNVNRWLRGSPHPGLARSEINPAAVQAVGCPVDLRDICLRWDEGYFTTVNFRRCCAGGVSRQLGRIDPRRESSRRGHATTHRHTGLGRGPEHRRNGGANGSQIQWQGETILCAFAALEKIKPSLGFD